ncbi:MAG: hypothetical protein QXU02_01090 [Candidatus Bathyarchaeia archaeon]
MRLNEAIMLSKDLRIFGRTFSECAKVMGDTTQVVKSVKPLMGNYGSSGLGSKLIAAGMACIVFPEPVVSDIIGSTLIAAGMLIKSRRGLTAMDVLKETRKIMNDLRRISVEL